ncbi:hypothetical protein PDG61_06735 [Mycolicibacterium sp. BiH015]|uniref:hypothetical protein n=1 Tax=Mycolicibacterium sp. BiH015 TaxID=3018808 RepID=UPI0022E51C95|nr:hypothetical protein [Mycolicibacterium sp. BiH015]MDA2890599.1 hypothetical protein [Mycolicibacterium sp. BiH015]
MSKRAQLAMIGAAAALSASLVGLNPGTAAARPMTEAQCAAIENEMMYYRIKMNAAERAGKQSEFRY